MSEKPDGGAAFPDVNEHGMSLRDYFAAHAPMPHDAWITSEMAHKHISYAQVCAAHAYHFADVMLVEREK